MNRQGLLFTAMLLIVLAVAYFIHQYLIAEFSLIQINPLWEYYLLNYLFSASTVIGLIELSRRGNNHLLGFAFLGSSLLKFLAFFIFFYGDLQEYPNLKKQEYLSFFFPYAISLTLEVVSLIHKLNRLDDASKSG